MARNPPNISCLLWRLCCFISWVATQPSERSDATHHHRTARHGITNFHNYALGQLKARLTRRTHTHTQTLQNPPKKKAVDKIHDGFVWPNNIFFFWAKSVGVAICVWSLYWYVFICSSGRFIPLTTPSESSWVQSSFRLSWENPGVIWVIVHVDVFTHRIEVQETLGLHSVLNLTRWDERHFCWSNWGWQFFLFMFLIGESKCPLFFFLLLVLLLTSSSQFFLSVEVQHACTCAHTNRLYLNMGFLRLSPAIHIPLRTCILTSHEPLTHIQDWSESLLKWR